jgi:hypothetical protein
MTTTLAPPITTSPLPLHPHAAHAIRAAENCCKWGRYATLRYLRSRNIPFPLFTLARILSAAKGI